MYHLINKCRNIDHWRIRFLCGSLLILMPSLAKKLSKYMRDAIYFSVITKRTKWVRDDTETAMQNADKKCMESVDCPWCHFYIGSYVHAERILSVLLQTQEQNWVGLSARSNFRYSLLARTGAFARNWSKGSYFIWDFIRLGILPKIEARLALFVSIPY